MSEVADRWVAEEALNALEWIVKPGADRGTAERKARELRAALDSPAPTLTVEQFRERLTASDDVLDRAMEGFETVRAVADDRSAVSFAIDLAVAAAITTASGEVEGCGQGHYIEIDFDGINPSCKLIHPETGCPPGEENESCWLTDWIEAEGAELVRGKLTLPVRWEQDPVRDHPLFHLPDCKPNQAEGEGAGTTFVFDGGGSYKSAATAIHRLIDTANPGQTLVIERHHIDRDGKYFTVTVTPYATQVQASQPTPGVEGAGK